MSNRDENAPSARSEHEDTSLGVLDVKGCVMKKGERRIKVWENL
jgi:hypothetical protein